MSCRPREKQLHNAHHFETVTVYYRWHPLAGKTLRVQKHQKDRCGEYIFVRLPDDTTCGLPSWMFSPACAEFVIGTPAVSIAALTELRDLLATLRAVPSCGIPSVKQPFTEVPNEAASAHASGSAVQSAANRDITNGNSRGQNRRTRSGTRRTTPGRRQRKPRSGSNRRSE